MIFWISFPVAIQIEVSFPMGVLIRNHIGIWYQTSILISWESLHSGTDQVFKYFNFNLYATIILLKFSRGPFGMRQLFHFAQVAQDQIYYETLGKYHLQRAVCRVLDLRCQIVFYPSQQRDWINNSCFFLAILFVWLAMPAGVEHKQILSLKSAWSTYLNFRKYPQIWNRNYFV